MSKELFEIQFEVRGDPVGVNRKNVGGKRRPFALTKEYREWKRKVRNAAWEAMIKRPPGKRKMTLDKVSVSIAFYFKRAGVSDCDGPVKPTLDALEGLIYEDDRQVWITTIRKYEKGDRKIGAWVSVTNEEFFDE